MGTGNSITGTDNQDGQDEIDALVASWHDLVNSADELVENGMLDQAVYQHQQALTLARNLFWPEAELFNLRKLIDLLQDLGQSDESTHYLRQGIAKADELEDADTKAWLCYQLAEILWPEDKPEAFHWYQAALDAAPFPEDWSAITLYYMTLGLHLHDEQQYTEAAVLYQEAAERAAKAADTAEILSFRLNAAWAYSATNNWDMAIEQLQTALALPDISVYPEKAAEISEELGDTYYLSGQQMQAKSIFEQAVELSRQLRDVNSQINQLLKLGSAYQAVGDPAAAERVISEALRLARQQQDLKRVVKALRDLSKTKLMLGEQETAVIPLQEASAITRDLDDRDLELDCLTDLASVYKDIGLTTAATETAVAGLEYAFEYDNTTAVLRFLSILSGINDLPASFWTTIDKLAALALDRSRQSDYPLALSECLPVLGNLYIEQDPQKTLKYYQELADLFQAEGSISRYVTTCGLIASAYQYMDDWDQAINALQEGLRQIRKQKSSYLTKELSFLLNLAYLYWKSGDLSKSEKYLASITQKTSLDELDIDLAFQITEQQGDLYFAQSNYRLAENAYQAALNLLERQFYSAVTPNVRLKIRAAGRFLYGRLVLASLRQINTPSANRRQTFLHVETARSRLFLSQLGQTPMRSPHQIPNYLLMQEQDMLAKLHLLAQQSSDESANLRLKERIYLWRNLQQLWQEMANYGVEAEDFVSQRRGSAITYHELQACLSTAQ